jgi:hypothetical protein
MRLTNLAYLFGFAALVSFGCGGSSDSNKATGGTTGTTVTGGTTAATGGTTAATGGTTAATGGTTAATGGTTGTTPKPGCPAMPSCVTAATTNCTPSGACTTSGDMLTTPMTMCYDNGVKMGVGMDPATMGMNITLKKGATVCMTGATGPISLGGDMAITFKDGAGKTLFTANTKTAADGTSSTTYTCPDGTSTTVSEACDDIGGATTGSSECTQSAACKM